MASISYANSRLPAKLKYVTLPDLLDEKSSTMPNKEAHVFRYENGVNFATRVAITFRELADKSLALAASLLKLGIKPGDRVAVVGRNCHQWLYLEYACMRIRVILVRVPALLVFPGTLQDTLIKHNCTCVVIGLEKLLTNFDTFLPGDLFYEQGKPGGGLIKHIFLLEKMQQPNLPHFSTVDELTVYDSSFDLVKHIQESITPDDVAVVFPTSGTTGSPKNAAMTHFSMINSLYNGFGKHLSLTKSASVFFSDRPFTWSGGFPIISVVFGITTIHQKPSAGSCALKYTFEMIMEERVTAIYCMPYFIYDTFEAVGNAMLDIPPLLEHILVAGERLSLELQEFIKMHFKHACMGYGSSEQVLVAVSSEKLDMLELMPYYEAKIINESGKVKPRGQIGNLRVRSIFSMVSYLDDPQLTSEAFDSNRWYHTGDIAVMNNEGLIEIIGRKKDVICRGGNKIYPYTVEKMVATHPKIDRVAVIGVPDERLFNEVCACIIPKSGDTITEEEIRSFCDDTSLDESKSMTPKFILMMDSFPKGPTGKVDIRQLKSLAIKQLNI